MHLRSRRLPDVAFRRLRFRRRNCACRISAGQGQNWKLSADNLGTADFESPTRSSHTEEPSANRASNPRGLGEVVPVLWMGEFSGHAAALLASCRPVTWLARLVAAKSSPPSCCRGT